MNQQKVRLQQSDWDALFPMTPYKLGSQTLMLKPLTLSGLANIMALIKGLSGKLRELGITFETIELDIAQKLQLVELILTDSPEILTEMTNIDVEDIRQLPLPVALDLFVVCLDLNLSSQESLVKNFKGLGEKVAKMTMGNPLQ